MKSETLTFTKSKVEYAIIELQRVNASCPGLTKAHHQALAKSIAILERRHRIITSESTKLCGTLLNILRLVQKQYALELKSNQIHTLAAQRRVSGVLTAINIIQSISTKKLQPRKQLTIF